MSVHRLQRWPNITPTMGQRLVFAGRHVYYPTRDIGPMLVQYWSTICYVGPTLNQPCVNVACLLGTTGVGLYTCTPANVCLPLPCHDTHMLASVYNTVYPIIFAAHSIWRFSRLGILLLIWSLGLIT